MHATCVCMPLTLTCSDGSHTWYASNVNMPSAILEVLQAFSDNVGFRVVPDAALQSHLLCLQHGWQTRVRQTLHYDTLHQGTTVIVFDKPHPLQHRLTVSHQGSMSCQYILTFVRQGALTS